MELIFVLGAAMAAAGLLADICHTITAKGHSSDDTEAADLARLTAPLPDEREPGRHRLGHADGTQTQQQRWNLDTAAMDLTELRDALEAVA